MPCRIGLAAVLVIAAAGPGWASPVVEPRTGLSVDPPPGYEAAQETPRGRATAALKVTHKSDSDAGCIIGFEERARQDVTLEDLNRENGKPENIKLAERALGVVQDVKSFRSATVSGVVGFIAVVDPKAELAKGNPSLSEQRTLMAMLETPKGRTVAACVAKKSAFPARHKEFEAIVRTVVAPR